MDWLVESLLRSEGPHMDSAGWWYMADADVQTPTLALT